MPPTIRVIHNLPRSGGTLLARCLGCMDHVTLLSEIHPNGSAAVDPATQAKIWFHYQIPEGLDFLDTIEAIRSCVEADGKSLIIREWSFPDFLPRYPHDRPPSRSMLLESLASRYTVVRLSLLRKIDDVWKSLLAFEDRSIPAGEYRMSCSDFLRGYMDFRNMAQSTGFVRYEDLCDNAANTLKRACDMLHLPFDEKFADKWKDYQMITGDVASLGRKTIGKR
jgi:hypothetical protein